MQAARFYAALQRHNDQHNPYCIPLYAAFVIGHDIKQEYQVIHVNCANIWFLLNAVRTIKPDWAVQLNGDATFGFYRADIDMIALGFCPFGRSNNPACFHTFSIKMLNAESMTIKRNYEEKLFS